MMAAPNPYEPPTENNKAKKPRSHPPIGRVTLLLIVSIVASVPFLGYFVHATKTEQMVAVWISWAWVAGLIIGVILFVASIAYPSNHRGARAIETILLMYMLIASVIGFGGVRNAVMELLAG